MNRDDAEEYTQSLGQIVAGSWRQIALAKRLGVPKALGLSTEQWVNDRLNGYVKLSIAERRAAVAELTGEGMSQRQVGEILGVDPATVNRDVANATSRNDNPAETEQADVANATPDPLSAVATLAATEAVQRAVRQAEERDTRREERLANIAAIAAGNIELSLAARYPVIYADPPWRYENPPIGASNRSIENHYPTMTLDEICALPVSQIATDDAMLYLWATAPKLFECMSVITTWGFEYRTCAVWDKELIGTGYHFRNQHELLLIAKRGEIPPPAAGTQPSSIYRERRRDHSVKPSFFYEMIEAAYPQLPKIELFSRSPRQGWAAWGNQASAA